jgi:hypothetical protein
MDEETLEQHHPYGPSRWPGLCVCPGYEPRKGGDNEFADRGTAIHKAVETGDYKGLRLEDAETAKWMTEELMRLTQGLDTDAEVKTCIPYISGLDAIEGVFGTSDRRWETEDGTLHVLDFKGFTKIGMKDFKPQIAGYILGGKRPQNDRIVCHIFHGGSQQVETFEMTWMQCVAYAFKVSDAIMDPDAPRCHSDHCDNCAKAGDCPQSATVIAYGAMAAGRLSVDMVRSNPAAAARLCDWLDAAAKRIEEAKEIIATVAKEGVEIYDPISGVRYGIQEREGRASVPPVGSIIDALMMKDGVDSKVILDKASLTLTSLRELVGKARAEEYVTRGETVKCFVRKGKDAKALKG